MFGSTFAQAPNKRENLSDICAEQEKPVEAYIMVRGERYAVVEFNGYLQLYKTFFLHEVLNFKYKVQSFPVLFWMCR